MHDAIQAFHEAVHLAFGHAPESIEPGKLHRFPTSDRRGDDAGFCKLFDDQRGGFFGDFRSGHFETWFASRPDDMTTAQRLAHARHIDAAKRERDAVQADRWHQNARRTTDLWERCFPLVMGDPVTRYLKRRLSAAPWPLPPCLRFHPALPYAHDGETIGHWPAMVAELRSQAGKVVALHRTWLTQDGHKAPVPGPVRKLTPTCGPLAGACIPLYGPIDGRMGVAEGIETALAASLGSCVPVVAAYSAGSLSAWQWPARLRTLVVFADHDPAGQEAATKLRDRAHSAGLAVQILAPSDAGTDWCDVWSSRSAAVDGGTA